MKWELYLSPQEWEEIKAAVRDRAPHDKQGRPCCEWCKKPHGRLKRSKRGYLVPHWLHTAHVHGAPMKSKNPADYLALCDGCHMQYDRSQGAGDWIPPYRQGYQVTTTGDLIVAMKGVGLDIWQDGEVWFWRCGNEGGTETSAVLAVGAAFGRMAVLREETVE
jgi:hypothetical protein